MQLATPAERGAALRAVDLPDPQPAPGEVVIRVGACAVCRTDLQICRGELAARRLPIVPGHQAVGVVEALGREVSRFRVGERAAVTWLAGACGRCRLCRSGRENLCERSTFTGWDRDGGFAERLAARADFAVRVPRGLDDVEVAPLLCGGAIGYRSLAVCGIVPGERLGLFGFGASALCTIQVALHRGCEVYVVTRSARDRERARAIGAAWAGGYDEPVPVPLDAAITFAPAGDVVVAALRAVGRGGTVAVNAIHLDRLPEMPYELLWWERSLRSVANLTRDDAEALLALASEIPIRTAIERFRLEDADLALARLEQGEIAGAAVLVP